MAVYDQSRGLERRDEDRRLGFDRRGTLMGWGEFAPEAFLSESHRSSKHFHFRSFQQRRRDVNRRRQLSMGQEASISQEYPSAAVLPQDTHWGDRPQSGPGFDGLPEDGLPALPPTLVAAINELIDACRERVQKRRDQGSLSGDADNPEATVWEMVDYCTALNQVIDRVINYHGQDQDHMATALRVASQAMFSDPKVAHEAFLSAMKESARRQNNAGLNDNFKSVH